MIIEWIRMNGRGKRPESLDNRLSGLFLVMRLEKYLLHLWIRIKIGNIW